MGARVLLVNDVDGSDLLSALRDRGYAVDAVRSASDAREALDRSAYDVVVLDASLPASERRALVDTQTPLSLVILGDDPNAPGSHHRLTWVERAPSFAELIARVDGAISERLARGSSAPPGVVHGEELAPLLDRTAALANERFVFLWGESGVGKDVLATWLHRRSSAGARPYVHVNLAAIPAAMLRSELFGAGEDRRGYERAEGYVASARAGTLVLDDVSEMPLDVQHDTVSAVEVALEATRVVVLARKSPGALLAEGALHPDLHERVVGAAVELPPLRERPTEILLLARHFLERFARALGRPSLRFSSDAEAALAAYDFPGNVRELRNVVERAVLTASGSMIETCELDLGQLGPRDGGASPTSYLREISSKSSKTLAFRAVSSGAQEDDPSLKLVHARNQALDGFEKSHIAQVMRRTGGSRTRTAQILGISRSTLWEKLRKYRID